MNKIEILAVRIADDDDWDEQDELDDDDWDKWEDEEDDDEWEDDLDEITILSQLRLVHEQYKVQHKKVLNKVQTYTENFVAIDQKIFSKIANIEDYLLGNLLVVVCEGKGKGYKVKFTPKGFDMLLLLQSNKN